MAGSPPRTTLAVWTGPHSEEPSPNWVHSANDPEATVTWGRVTLKACWKIRSPKLPVSSRMSVTVWQVEVPGLQTVTLTHGLLGYEPLEQSEPSTVTESTLAWSTAVTVRSVEPETLPGIGSVTVMVAVIVVEPAITAVALPLEPILLLMVATDGAEELQVTDDVRSRVVVSENVPVAVNCWVVPAAMLGLSGRTEIDTSVAVVTVRVVEA